MAQELPTDDMTDRAILLFVQDKLATIFDTTLHGLFDVRLVQRDLNTTTSNLTA